MRRLAAFDLMLLYAIATRDAALATKARNAFQHTTDEMGGFANLAQRFNARLETASTVSPRLADIEPVSVLEDALRERIGIPRYGPGLLLVQTSRRRIRSAAARGF